MGGESLRDLIAMRVQAADFKLPMLNAVAMELHKTLGDPQVPSGKIEKIIARDPAVAGEVLRMANSAFYAGLTQTETLREALLRLGTQRVGQLAIAAAQQGLYRSKLPLVATRMERLWPQAYVGALGCKWLAERSGHADLAEAAFLAGLLRDIGMLVVLKAVEDLSAKDLDVPEGLLDELLDSLHCEQGHRVLCHWNLPERYALIARDHHLPPDAEPAPLMSMVRLIDQLCLRMGIGCPADPTLMPALSPDAQHLGMSELRLAELEILLEDSLAQRSL